SGGALCPAPTNQPRRTNFLLFFQGLNNRFGGAVYGWAQIVHDSRVPAIPVLFSWPSRGEVRLVAYAYDRESASYSRTALEQLLDSLSANPNVNEITVLAHSMGCVVTLGALRAIQSRRFGDKVKNGLLVAPDVAVNDF